MSNKSCSTYSERPTLPYTRGACKCALTYMHFCSAMVVCLYWFDLLGSYKSFSLPEPQFPHLYNGDSNSTYFIGLL